MRTLAELMAYFNVSKQVRPVYLSQLIAQQAFALGELR